MFKSMLSARIEIVRLLLALPSLQSAWLIDGLESATNENETTEPGTAREDAVTRAPISLLKAAMTKCAGPEMRKCGEPDPAISTPGNAWLKLTAVAFVYPQTRRVSTPLT